MTSTSVLITGGAGFIGRALVAYCIDRGHRVTVIDNLCAGRAEHLRPFGNAVKLYQADILDASMVDKAMADARPAIVFHLAAHHFIPFCDAHPSETLRVNVEGTQTVFASAARHGVRHAVLASSGAFYPGSREPLSEVTVPAPADIYGLSKLMAEQVASLMAATAGINVVAARLFNTYGPYETNPHLIPHIIESIKRGGPISLGNVNTRRDYIYVDDVAELLYRLAFRDGSFVTVNVGTGEEFSAEEVIDTIAGILGRPIKIEIDPARLRAVDKPHQRADTRRLEAVTGMLPRHSLETGLRQLLRHEALLFTTEA